MARPKREVLPTDEELGRHYKTKCKCTSCGGRIHVWFDIKKCTPCLRKEQPTRKGRE